MADPGMTFHLKVWRQAGPDQPGRLVDYKVSGISPDISFLEMFDVLNEQLTREGKEPIEYDNDCREGICGTCGLVINGVAHGKDNRSTTCQLRMRMFQNGQTITVEPFRAKAFPVVKDLVVDRSSMDRIIAKGGYVSVNTGSAPDANAIPVHKDNSESAFDSAACIGCGACVAACPNASISLFVSTKISQYTFLPQGQVERKQRALRMAEQMDLEGFGNCSNHAECEAVCPKQISIANIARMRREFFKAALAK